MSGAPTLGAALVAATARLAAAGVDEPRADAEVLAAHALGTDRTGIVLRARAPLEAAAAARLDALVARRSAREPVFQLVGRREFWSLEVAVDARVLTPRPETELLVETALRLAPGARRVLDGGTGSGALAAALARELPHAAIVASDRSCEALAVAAANLRRLAPRVALVAADWLGAFRAGAFDLVVANPPYVATAALAALPPEIRCHEPRLALDGGPDGLAAVRALLATASAVLAPGGWLLVELGAGQAHAAAALAAAAACWGPPRRFSDGAGHERVLAVRRADGGEGEG